MVLDKALAPAGSDISERERAGAGPGGRSAGGSDPPQEVDELLGACAEMLCTLRPEAEPSHQCA